MSPKKSFLTAITLPTREEVIKAAGEAFDKYVAPIDVPVIPNILETSIRRDDARYVR